MFKKRIWFGIILLIILLVFSVNGFTSYYKYTQESGANFYVSIADKADALENHNEIRQILDDLGNLLVHSKRDDSYPKDTTTGGTLSIPNSALALLAAGAKGDILYCSAANVWSKLSIGADNKVLVVSTDVPNWETLTSDLLSDVASVAMLDENEAILGDWTVTGSIGGVDTTEFGYLATISAFGASIIDDADEAAFKATVNLEIGTDVLAYQTIGIADDNLLEMDQIAGGAVNDYCKLTINGIVGRSYSEVKTDLDIDLSLYYLKTQIDTQGELEIIWGVTLATDSELDALTYSDVGAEQADAGLTNLAGLTYFSPSFIKVTATDTYAIRTIAEVKSDLSLNNVENTALSTWAGTESITTLGTIATGIWNGTPLVIGKLPIAVVGDGDTTHVPTSDNVYDFCETTQNYALNSELHSELTLGTASGLSLVAQELSLAINSDTTAGAVTSGVGQNQRVWKTDAAGVPGWRMDEGGVEASTFVALSDTPTFYTDQAHKFPRVNAAEDGMEFYTMPGGGDVLGPVTSTDNTIARFDGTDNKVIQGSLATISDTGTINIPLGQTYKINNVSLSYTDVGAIEDAADVIVSSHVDWGAGADQVDTDNVPEGSNNLYQLTGEEIDDYVYALISDVDSVHTLITITYDDENDAYDFVVNDDLSLYSNAVSLFITKSVNNLDYYYLKTEIDTQGEVETIWEVTLSTDAERNALTYSDVGAQQVDAALTSISGLAYVSPSFIKLTANDTYAVRTLTEVKADLGIDLSLYYLKTEIDTLGEVETIYSANIIDNTELATALTDYYLKTAIDTLGELETIYVKDIIDSDELAALKFTDLDDTPANYTGNSLKIARVNVGETALEFAEESDPMVDTDAEIKAILIDEVTKTGDFIAGRIAKINNATGIIEQGTNTDTDVADAVTKKHAVGSDTTLGTLTADVNMGTHKLTGLSVPSASGQSVRTTATITEANLEDAVSKKHTQNTDTQFDFYNALADDHTWSGDKDTQPVGESVVFGDLLYFNWTDKEWKKTDADAEATMPGLRIALETKSDGQTCLMLVKGYIRDDDAFAFAGAMVYASVTPGDMSSTAPTETGDQLQRVGQAKSADILFFDPSIDVGEI